MCANREVGEIGEGDRFCVFDHVGSGTLYFVAN